MAGVNDDPRSDFRARYARERTPTVRELERQVLGHDVGLAGYTTVPQAQVLTEALAPSKQDLVLDLGAGRGWPGLHVAATAGCRVLLTDLPREALGQAKAQAARRGLDTRVDVAVADATRLPLRPACVEGIVHADVF